MIGNTKAKQTVYGNLPEAGYREKELGMNQGERRKFLIRKLQQENARYWDVEIPAGEEEQRQLLRGLMSVRLPGQIGSGHRRYSRKDRL